jgi:hypothetical protein
MSDEAISLVWLRYGFNDSLRQDTVILNKHHPDADFEEAQSHAPRPLAAHPKAMLTLMT